MFYVQLYLFDVDNYDRKPKDQRSLFEKSPKFGRMPAACADYNYDRKPKDQRLLF